jgi:type IV pilus assembly protein PilC
MAIYKYSGTDANGNRREGTVDARSQELALSLLKNQGFFVINLNEQHSSFMSQFNNLMGIPQGDIVNFTRQFSTMVSAGLPLSRALEVLAEQTSNSSLKKILSDVLRDVEGGAPLSSSLGRYPKQFNATYQALVKAGESSGKLDQILKRLATTMETDREINSKFKGAMIYPAIVMIAMVGVLVLMMLFVIPKLADMYKSLNVELPLVTKVMISASDFMVQKFYVVVLATVGIFFAMKTFLKSDTGKVLVTHITFTLPVFGKLNRLRDITQFARTLSLLIASAIPIVEALKIVSNVVSSSYYRDASLEAAKVVEKGNSLSEYFRYNKNFPPLVGQMVSVGEETGQLDEVLDKVATYYAGEVNHSIDGLSAAMEPLILILLGSMVGLLIISIITPIYKITTSL